MLFDVVGVVRAYVVESKPNSSQLLLAALLPVFLPAPGVAGQFLLRQVTMSNILWVICVSRLPDRCFPDASAF